LWDVVLAESAVVDEQRKHVVELFAGVCRVEVSQLAEYGAPTHHPQHTPPVFYTMFQKTSTLFFFEQLCQKYAILMIFGELNLEKT